MKLPGQQDDAAGGQQGRGNPDFRVRLLAQDGLYVRRCIGKRVQIRQTVEHPPGDEDSDSQEGCQLDDRLHRNRQYQAVLIFCRVNVPGSERHCETCEQHGDSQRQRHGRLRQRDHFAGIDGLQDHRHGGCDCLELQRDIGKHADHGYDRDQRRHLFRLAIARCNKVGHGSDILSLCQADDAQDEGEQQANDDDRADIDG